MTLAYGSVLTVFSCPVRKEMETGVEAGVRLCSDFCDLGQLVLCLNFKHNFAFY